MKLKKALALLLALAMVFALAACGETGTATPTQAPATVAPATQTPATQAPAEEAEPVELIVFAAASMTETMTEIADLYEAVAPNVTLTYNFDSSGTLLTQIQEGADCDVFISAAQKQMNTLDDAGALLDGTRVDLLENLLALAVADGNPGNINSYDELIAGLEAGSVTLAMGNSDVPAGQYMQKVLAYYGADEAALANSGVITYGSNVKEVTTQVSEAAVDCGVIYSTDAYSAGLEVVDVATSDMTGGRVIYPATVLKATEHAAEAEAFLEYLYGEEASDVFMGVGFSPVEYANQVLLKSMAESSGEVIVFAAASMTETMNEIAGLYKAIAPNVTITYNFDSSGTLLTQIQEGADCDLFISAAQKQMNTLDDAGELMEGTRVNLLENKLALAVADGNPANIHSYDELIAGLQAGTVKLAMGNSDVPAGQYMQKVLAYYGVSEDELVAKGVITYGSNVKEVTTQVSESTVDCGVIYQTDAFSAKLEVVDLATADMTGGQVIYPAAELKAAPNAVAALLFLEYLKMADASAVFESVGFTALS